MVARIEYNMTADEYHAHPAISRSALEDIAINPQYFLHKRNNPEEKDTKTFAFGRAFHTFILEPELFVEKYVILPEDAPRRPSKTQLNAKKPSSDTLDQIAWWKDFDAANANNVVLKKEEHQKLVAMAKQVKNHPGASSVLSLKGKPEVTIFWTDEETGVECKARLDWLADNGIIVDAKSCRSANPDPDAEISFVRDAFNHGYTMQADWYSEAYRQYFGKEPTAFIFTPVEKEAPHCVSAVRANDLFLHHGNMLWRKYLAIYAQCKKSGIWPGYGDTIVTLGLPGWVERKLNYQGA